jgi:hypothetical protein
MNAEQFKFKIIQSGNTEFDKRKPCNFKVISLEEIIKWIDNQFSLDEDVKSELKKSVQSYPQDALSKWSKNYLHHLEKAQANVRKKQKTNSIKSDPKEK